MSTFIVVDDPLLSQRIFAARFRVVFIAPAVSQSVAEALGKCFQSAESISITVVLDPDEEPYRLGYGDREGLELVRQLAQENHIALRSQPGLRVGLLLIDNDILIWSPTPHAVETQRTDGEPNGVNLSYSTSGASSSAASSNIPDSQGSQAPQNIFADLIQNAVGADDSNVLLNEAEIGRTALTPELAEKTIKLLKENPPTPFDLARKSRVFSTRYQYVEFELRGAEWTQREIKLSSLLLNSDVPEEFRELFETHIKPFSHKEDVTVNVPALVQGEIAYNQHGAEILVPMTQSDIEKSWKALRQRYMSQLPGFGWLIRRADKEKFNAEIRAFETVLKAWVKGFRKESEGEQKELVDRIVSLIQSRSERFAPNKALDKKDLEKRVCDGIQNLRITEPSVKLLFKEISWESARDKEFTDALRKALPAEDLKGWFEIFTAARERTDVETICR